MNYFITLPSRVENLVNHSITSTLNSLSIYQQLQHLPRLRLLPTQLTEHLAESISHIAYNNLIYVRELFILSQTDEREAN